MFLHRNLWIFADKRFVLVLVASFAKTTPVCCIKAGFYRLAQKPYPIRSLGFGSRAITGKKEEAACSI